MRLSLLIAFAAGCSPCQQLDNGLEICGDLAAPIGIADGLEDAAWPAALDGLGNALLAVDGALVQVSPDGSVQTVLEGAISPPARDAQGRLYFSAGGTVTAWQDGELWSTAVPGAGALPPSLSADRAYAPGSSDLVVLDRATGAVQATIPDSSGAGIAADGSLRVLSERIGDGVFAKLRSLDASGTQQQWQLDQPGGLVDFSVGADGDTYAVTTHGELLRVDVTGDVVWRYTPACDTCVVGGAPTVTATTVYVPVWQAATSSDGCADPIGDAVADLTAPLVDPLHAIDIETATLLWSFEGFTTGESELAYDNFLSDPLAGPLNTTTTLDHPGGRPAVTADGTSYVGADGGLAMLNTRGRSQGRAVWAADEGESFERCAFGGVTGLLTLGMGAGMGTALLLKDAPNERPGRGARRRPAGHGHGPGDRLDLRRDRCWRCAHGQRRRTS